MLEALVIEGTEDIPHIILDCEKRIFLFKGNSMPENTTKFYAPIISWIEEYIKSPNKETRIECHLEYLNSSSSRKFFEIFLRFQEILNSGNSIDVRWEYSKDDLFIQEKGFELKELLEIPFILKEI